MKIQNQSSGAYLSNISHNIQSKSNNKTPSSAETKNTEAADKVIYAESGRDKLPVTTDGSGKYTVHFEHSAMVIRTVERGSISIRGREIKLSDSDKSRLIAADKKAERQRTAAFNAYIVQHESAVMKQQSETMAWAAKNEMKAFETAGRIMKGEKPSPQAMRQLLKTDPNLYAAAVMMASSEPKKHTKKRDDYEEDEAPNKTYEYPDKPQRYETAMDVDMSGQTPVITNISETETQLDQGFFIMA